MGKVNRFCCGWLMLMLMIIEIDIDRWVIWNMEIHVDAALVLSGHMCFIIDRWISGNQQ